MKANRNDNSPKSPVLAGPLAGIDSFDSSSAGSFTLGQCNGSRIPVELQKIFIESNQGNVVHDAPTDHVANKTFDRKWFLRSPSCTRKTTKLPKKLILNFPTLFSISPAKKNQVASTVATVTEENILRTKSPKKKPKVSYAYVFLFLLNHIFHITTQANTFSLFVGVANTFSATLFGWSASIARNIQRLVLMH